MAKNGDEGYAIESFELEKRFKDLIAVNRISFKVRHGEIFAFLGPNGAGKTTTIKMLTTLLRPSGGRVLVNGHDPVTDKDKARHAFGIVFQDSSLDDELTALEKLEFHAVMYSVPKKVAKTRIAHLLRYVGLEDRKNDLVKNFSGGMKRRLEIARGLIHHPKILFLDEPTLGLDPQTRNNIWEHIKKLTRDEKMTVFFTTHYMEEAERVADNVAVVDRGHIVRQGTVKEIISSTGTKNLEAAFLKLTGKSIRDESGTALDWMRQRRQVFRR